MDPKNAVLPKELLEIPQHEGAQHLLLHVSILSFAAVLFERVLVDRWVEAGTREPIRGPTPLPLVTRDRRRHRPCAKAARRLLLFRDAGVGGPSKAALFSSSPRLHARLIFQALVPVPHPVPRQAQPDHRRRGAADRHCGSHAGLRAGGGEAGARVIVDGDRARAQSPLGRSDAVARRHRDDQADRRCREAARIWHDHIIVGKQGHASFRGLVLI